MAEWSNKVILMTGAGWSPAPEVVLAFAAAGAQIAAIDLTPVNLDELAGRIRAAGGVCEILTADVSSKIQAQTMIASVLERWGRIDVLAAAIGVRPRAPILELDEWDWRRALDSNLTGPFLVTQLAGRVMRELGGGCVLYLMDMTGQASSSGAGAAYAAGMAGLVGLTKAASDELSPFQIRVNAIIRGGLQAEAAGKAEFEGFPDGSATVAKIALRLCSQEAAQVTGQVISAR
jgi:NAD(P)-dependent dehydrogenase (short-subunit alcohol dehydrogenase family)